MQFKIIDDDTEEIITTLKVRKNMKFGTVIDKVKDLLHARRILPTGKVDLATGESSFKYVCFGETNRTIRIEEF